MLQSKLNAAADLYASRLERINRGGGTQGFSAGMKGQLANIEQAYKVGTKSGKENLRLVKQLGTELGRLATRRDQLTRKNELQSRFFVPQQEFRQKLGRLRVDPRTAGSSRLDQIEKWITALDSAVAKAAEVALERHSAISRLTSSCLIS